MKKRIIFIILTFLFVFVFVSCADNDSQKENSGQGKEDSAGNNIDVAIEESTEDIYADDLPEQDFGGAEFKIAVIEAHWLYVIYDSQEEIGEPINDSVYNRNRRIEERFNVNITQANQGNNLKRDVRAGIDGYQIFLPVDRDALTLGTEGLYHKISEIPYIDIDKPYYSQLINKCLTIGNELFFAYGAFNLSVYDYTQVLLFNKPMISDLGLESPYNLIKNGNWTFDVYSEMAKAAVKDVNGDEVMDKEDIYGLVSMPKNVMPCFWVAAGLQTISKSSDDLPQFTLREDEKFANVIDKIFEITYDNDSWYRKDVPDDQAPYFMDGHTLFSNCSFKRISDMRNIETDFGIIPYPKYTSEQDKYYTRVEGGNPSLVPITVGNLQMAGTILEALNAESAKTVIPAYYDITLKAKHARDEESAEMLDIIMDGRIYDLGDTYWSSFVRDIFTGMFSSNNRNLASRLESIEPRINTAIDKVIDSMNAN